MVWVGRRRQQPTTRRGYNQQDLVTVGLGGDHMSTWVTRQMALPPRTRRLRSRCEKGGAAGLWLL